MSEPQTLTIDVNGFPTRVWRQGSGPKLGFLSGFGVVMKMFKSTRDGYLLTIQLWRELWRPSDMPCPWQGGFGDLSSQKLKMEQPDPVCDPSEDKSLFRPPE